MRCGILASSGALRLKAEGLFVKNNIDVGDWFLNPKTDVRSSYQLEDVATEFDVQGLELDFSLVAWDADFRYHEGTWQARQFRGATWIKHDGAEQFRYRKNAYRVLLTRARQGMVLFIPEGMPRTTPASRNITTGLTNTFAPWASPTSPRRKAKNRLQRGRNVRRKGAGFGTIISNSLVR